MTRNWQDVLIAPTATLREALAAIDRASLQIALVTDGARRLLGTLTDGDVRRCILQGTNLETPVSDLMHRAPTTALQSESREALLVLMKRTLLHQIPIVDMEGRVVGLETIDELVSDRPNDHWVVLMAGGPGNRLRPLTEKTPKPLLEVGNKPLLETILETLIGYGFRRYFIAVNYRADAIKQRIGDGRRWNVEISYLEEKERLGTAGALALLPEHPTAPLLVMNADLLTNMNFRHLLAYHAEHACAATLCVSEHSIEVPYGVIDVRDHRLAGITEKPVQRFFINAGIYVLGPDSVDLVLRDTRCDMTDLLAKIISAGRQVAVFPIREFWLDIGQHENYVAAHAHYERFFR